MQAATYHIVNDPLYKILVLLERKKIKKKKLNENPKEMRSRKEEKRERNQRAGASGYLPNAAEALLGVGFASGGELDSLPNQSPGIVLLHYLQHSRPPKCTQPCHCHETQMLSGKFWYKRPLSKSHQAISARIGQ